MKPPHICQCFFIGAILCCSCIGSLADPLPISPPTNTTAPLPVVTRPHVLPAVPRPNLPTSTTSLLISFPNVPRGESVKLLDAKVTLQLEGASFLTALNTVLASAKVNCTVECRGVKAVKLSLHTKDNTAGQLLDVFAKVGGARLWVLPDKLLLAPVTLLTNDEKKAAKLYGVLLSPADLPKGAAWDKVPNVKTIAAIANTKISFTLNGANVDNAMGPVERCIDIPHHTFYSEYNCPLRLQDLTMPIMSTSLTWDQQSMGDAMALVAASTGCQLYLLPDTFLLCAPGEIPDQYKKQAIPAFTPGSTHFDFGPKPTFDPSAKGS